MRDTKLWPLIFLAALSCIKYGCNVCGRTIVENDNHLMLSGYVGCLFQDVCLSEEICLDDGLFGRCIEDQSVPQEAKKLSWSLLLKLENIILLLKNNVVDWEDIRVQCIVRTILHHTSTIYDDPEEMCGLQEPQATAAVNLGILKRGGDTHGESMEYSFLSDRPILPFVQSAGLLPFSASGYMNSYNRMSNLLLGDKEPVFNYNTNSEAYVHNPWAKGKYIYKHLAQMTNEYPTRLTSEEDNHGIALGTSGLSKIRRTQWEKMPRYPTTSRIVARSDGIPKRRYQLNLPYDLKPPTPPTRSWVWTKFLRRSLDAYEAEQFLRELSNRLDLTSPISNYFLDRTGNVLYFQVPEATGMSAEAVLLALKQGKGNFDGYETENVGFGRGAPVYRATTRKDSPKKLSMSLVICLAVVGFAFVLSVIYVIHLGCTRFRRFKRTDDTRMTLISSEHSNDEKSAEKLKHAGSGLLERINRFVRPKVGENLLVGSRRTSTQSCSAVCEAVTGPMPVSPTSSTSSKRTTLTYPLNGSTEERKISLVTQKDFPAFSRCSTSSWSSEPVSCGIDVNTGHTILSYMERYLNDENLLTGDWEAVSAYESEEATPCEDACKSENVKKNRTCAPIPFELSRVRLRNAQQDYINASLLYDHSPRNPVYIATPSPMTETLADFWEMIWEQSCVVLVNLERSEEIKSANMRQHPEDASVKYWPDEGTKIYGTFEVHLVSEHSWCEDYIVRSFYLKNLKSGETRTVTQFHYLAWNDEMLKLRTKSLLEFRRKVNRSFRGMMSPIVVHCIDGAGRTGTYILLDLVLNRVIKGIKEMNIAASLEHLRDQRQGMVGNKEQYEFVFTAVAQEVDAMLKANEPTE